MSRFPCRLAPAGDHRDDDDDTDALDEREDPESSADDEDDEDDEDDLHDDPRAVIAYAARKLVIATARKLGDQPREVALRPKSRAFIFGALRRSHPDAPEELVREVVQSLHLGALPSIAVARRWRPPIQGREPLSDRVWRRRVTVLAACLDLACLATPELVAKARHTLAWTGNLTAQVLAAGEHIGALGYSEHRWRVVDPSVLPSAPPQLALPFGIALNPQPEAPRRPLRRRDRRPQRLPDAQLSLLDWRPPEPITRIEARRSRPPSAGVPSESYAAVG